MTLVQIIDSVVGWLEREVCSQITLKLPDDFKNDATYGVELVHPAAFPLYVPGKDRLPPSIPAPIPSVCVQLMEGNDNLLEKKRQLQIRLCLACWNPGEHGLEKFIPHKNPKEVGGISYFHPTDEAAKTYERNMSGWRDSYNFTDLILRSLECAEYVGGLRVVKESEVKYGPFTEEGNIWDYYPYWHNWISFTLECGVVARVPAEYENYL